MEHTTLSVSTLTMLLCPLILTSVWATLMTDSGIGFCVGDSDGTSARFLHTFPLTDSIGGKMERLLDNKRLFLG